MSPSDIAKLLSVSRVTASMWFNGHTQPHRLLEERVEEMRQRIRTALDAGDLPIPHHVTRRERSLYLRRALQLDDPPEA